MSNFELTREFHHKFDVPVLPTPQWPDDRRKNLRINLLREECAEVIEAIESGNLSAIAKELCDLLIVCYGTGHEYGLQLDRAFREVHLSNMTKLGNDGRPVLRPTDGKVIKGPNYREPVQLLFDNRPTR